MKGKKLEGTIFERSIIENAAEQAANNQAAIDYNIMMGNLEDPEEEEETENA